MYLQRERTLTVRMADYETYKFGATVGYTHYDLGITDADLAAMTTAQRKDARDRLAALVEAELGRQLQGEIKETLQLSRNPDSFINMDDTQRRTRHG